MRHKYFFGTLAIIMTLSIALAAGFNDDRESRGPTDFSDQSKISLTSPKTAPVDRTSGEKSAAQTVVWDNGMTYVGLLTAQDEGIVDGLDSEPADDFIFEADQMVNDVHWIGGYWNGPPDDGDFDWKVRFYADDGTGAKPGAMIASYTFANADVNETFIGDLYYYSYSVVLPSTLTFFAGTKYWISIQALGASPPQSGWAYHEDPDILLHQAVIRSVYFGLPDWTDTEIALGVITDMCFQLTYEEECSWNPGDPHKMHFPQLPDEDGWDVNATEPVVLADDFMCMQDGPITDVHWWGGWKNDIEGEIISFVLSIHTDIPADPPGIPYSRPGLTLWELEVFDFNATMIDPPSTEGWYDPSTGETIWDAQAHYWQYDVCIDPVMAFYQDSGTIYWLNISARVADPQGTTWGWKSTEDHWNDDAVWAYWGELNWIDIWEPAAPLVNAWGVAFDPAGGFVGGFGENSYGEGWYFYPEEGWWNIWFYDHPFDSTRKKYGMIEFDAFPLSQDPMWLEVAVNWSTDIWSIEQPPGDSMPPLPGVPEEVYIGREILFASDYFEGHYGPFFYEIPDYNPEWVSIDVRGWNFDIPAGIIEHTCQGSLDLAFVITGEPLVEDSGACCYDPTGGGIDASCIYTTLTYCEQILGGVFEGVGVPCQGMEACCLPDGNCVMADALCCVNELGGTPQGAGSSCTATEACCFPDGTCQDLDPLCCVDQGGTPQGIGSSCSPLEACCMSDGSCRMLAPECCVDLGGTPQGFATTCQATIACCMPDGTCQTVSRVCCDDIGGTASPIGAPMCIGDLNGDGSDDACDVREDLKWRQAPDLEPTGIDVAATCPSLSHECIVLADDFLCTEAGPITEVHIYGSWYLDQYPLGDPGNVVFTLSFHTDVPAGIDQPWSHPREMIWVNSFGPGQFDYRPYGVDLVEGYYDPIIQMYEPVGDFTCWEYIFYLDEPFIQEGTEIDPVTYWLDVQAYPEGESYFGWKTSFEHWNDDGVWAIGAEPIDPLIWVELVYPFGHPYETMSIDLAFELYGEAEGPCDCIPGDANNDGDVNVGDAVYLIAYVFKGGPPPTPYPICSGDANCDCMVNVGDAVYVISYVFKGGPPPCDCPTWLSLCGPPLRK